MSFYNCPFICFWDLYFSIRLWVTVWCPFIPPCRSPLSVSCKAGLEVTNALIFYLGMSSFLPHSLGTVLPDTEFLVDSWNICPTVFWPPKFLMRNLLLILLRIISMWWFSSLAAFKILFLSMAFQSFIIMCLSVGVFQFILTRVHHTYWTLTFMSSIKLWEVFRHYFFK